MSLRKQSAELINEVIHNATPEELDYILRKSSISPNLYKKKALLMIGKDTLKTGLKGAAIGLGAGLVADKLKGEDTLPGLNTKTLATTLGAGIGVLSGFKGGSKYLNGFKLQRHLENPKLKHNLKHLYVKESGKGFDVTKQYGRAALVKVNPVVAKVKSMSTHYPSYEDMPSKLRELYNKGLTNPLTPTQQQVREALNQV
ncbi:MAG: hypothetical protein WC967_15945 [Balneolaceae bacterium]